MPGLTFTMALAMLIPATLIHLTEMFLILYPGPMMAVIAALKSAGAALLAIF